MKEKRIERERNRVEATRVGLNALQQTTDSIFELNAQARQDELNQDLANLDARKQAELVENIKCSRKSNQKEYAAKNER